MGKLTTHVLDTANGRPGAGIKVELFALSGDTRRALKTTLTNDDGRCDEPLLQGDALVPGEYELVFAAGDYFAS
ncbi:hydroxyisourate hydrolase, partial [Paraburkholderia sp. SIMBA_053]